MKKSSNLTNKNQTTTTFSGSISVQVQTGNSIIGSQIGDNANFSVSNYQSSFNQPVLSTAVNNESKPNKQSRVDEENKQSIENNNSPAPTSSVSEGCCSLKIGKLGCGKVVSFWCFNLEPSAEDVYLVCCPKKPKEQDQQETKEINSTNNKTQYQSVPQMEAQIQADPNQG